MSGEPQIAVEQAECGMSKNPGQWLFKWQVRNVTATPMNLLSVRVPHGKFKADERKLGPAAIAAQGSITLDLVVASQEPPNTVIENAFLILLLDWQENDWRFFARLRITVDRQGCPQTTTESITVQQVGFSGVSD